MDFLLGGQALKASPSRRLESEALQPGLAERWLVDLRNDSSFSFAVETDGEASCCVLMQVTRCAEDVLGAQAAVGLFSPHLPQLGRSVGFINEQ